MKKPIFNKKGTKQIIHSGWAEFDRQTESIGPGAAICSTQISGYVRPFCQRVCNGALFESGELMENDIAWTEIYQPPKKILDFLRDAKRTERVILYMFYVTDKFGCSIPFLWVVTSANHKPLMDSLIVISVQNLQKMMKVREEILSYIIDQTSGAS